ncbi:MAG: ATP-binding cassette domain-containing protein [Gammaproteobacteria bacterium]|nr:ATP-binding cassette domain-containing protein [Gammaproteobacteria bacterium]
MRPEYFPTDVGILPLAVRSLGLRLDSADLLTDISFELAAGSPTVLLGANGAGKTLLLKLCHGLLRPSTGEIRWTGVDAANATGRQAMVFQRPVLLRRSVAANIDYALATRGTPRAERRSRVAQVLDETGLTPLAKRPARVLSGGEQQRLALARAWALTPEVLFMDEPTANLDPAATRSVENLIRHIAAAGTKIMLSTHDLAQAQRLAGEVLFLHRGQLVERGDAQKFFTEPASDAGRAFVRGELWW